MNTEHQLKSKIKISMICVSKEYEIKTKMVQEQWLQLKMTFLFFIGLNWLLKGVNEQIFGWLGESPIPPVGKTLYKLCQQVFIFNEKAPCTSHKLCAKVATLLLLDLSTLCVTDMYGIHCVFSVCNTINLSHHEHV